MPYARRYTRRRRPYRYRRRYRRRTRGTSLRRDVAKLKKNAKQEEQKYHDLVNNSTTINNAVSKINLNLIDQGDTASTRDGRRVSFIKIIVRGIVTWNASGPPQVVRLMVLRRIQNPPNSTGIDTDEIFQEDVATGKEAVLAFYDKEGLKGHYILKDFKCTLDAQHPKCYFNWHLRAGFQSSYINATPTVAQIRENLLQFWHVSDNETGMNNSALELETRLVYHDN